MRLDQMPTTQNPPWRYIHFEIFRLAGGGICAPLSFSPTRIFSGRDTSMTAAMAMHMARHLTITPKP